MHWGLVPGRPPTRYVAATDEVAAGRAYGATVSERDQSRRLAVGAGAPADPDPVADEPAAAGEGEPGPAVDGPGTPGRDVRSPSSGDVVQAVADFVEDLVEDVGTGDAPTTEG